MRHRLGFILVLLLLAGCDTVTDEQFNAMGQSERAVTTPAKRADLALVASALTNALADDRIRRDVRDAMRTSQYAEHKLDLYAHLRANQRLADAAGSKLAMSAREFERFVARLGPLDFYAPYREHRTTWRATADVIVGYTDDPDLLLYEAVSGSGHTAVLNGNQLPTSALLMIHPSEQSDIRLERPLNRGAGDVIQDADEPGILGAIMVKDARTGITIGVTPFGVCNPDVTPDCGGGGGGGGTTSTRLEKFLIFYGDGVGSAEVEYTISDDNHTKTVRFEDVNRDVLYYVDRELWTGAFSWSGGVNVSLIETDAFADDYWGFAAYRTVDKGLWASTETLCSSVGDPNTDVHPECSIPPYVTLTSNFAIKW